MTLARIIIASKHLTKERKMSLSKSNLALMFIGLVSLLFAGCPPTSSSPPPAGFQITATKGPHGRAVNIRGEKFSPGGQLKITYANIPNRPGTTDAAGPMPSIQSDGTFFFAETFNCTSHDASAENALVSVNACDLATGNCAPANVKAGGIWVDSGDPSCK